MHRESPARTFFAILLAMSFSLLAWAGAKPNQVQRLDSALTPVGALRAASPDGVIPAWDGGLVEALPGYTPGALHIDPFADEAVLFSITVETLEVHRAWLTPGQIALLTAYPDSYRMPVYPTHRSAAYPERIYDATRANGNTGRLTEDGSGVLDVAIGFPFPFPENGLELMWNHKLRYRGSGGLRHLELVAPTPSGDFQPVHLSIETLDFYHQPGATLDSVENRLLYLLQTTESPPRLAGNLLLVHESLNESLQPRNAWTYNPSQRRVIRAPNVAYDHPSSNADGLMLADMADMFNGALDRFDWKLLEQREIYVPYNAYRLNAVAGGFESLARPGHLDPGPMRYERHRVWVVEATLKPGLRHLHPRRTYYLDEDSYQVLLAEHYDERGVLWRFSEAHPVVFYEVPMLWSTLETHHDLQSRRYVSYRLDHDTGVARFDLELSSANFTPQALRRKGR